MPSLSQLASKYFWPEDFTLETANRHADQLATFFPMLYYRKKGSEIIALDQLKRDYADLQALSVEEIDKNVLNDLIFDFLNRNARKKLNYIDLTAFNQNASRQLTTVVLNAFHADNFQKINDWFQFYEQNLLNHILTKLPFINEKKWENKPTYFENLESLSYLWLSCLWDNKPVERASTIAGQMADAHAFLQATSCASQNDSSLLAYIDLYNYQRSYKQISEIKSIVFSLLHPFYFIYFEYREVALYEKNIFRKFFRQMMPIVMASAIIILSLVGLSLLAVPDIALAVALVPAIFLGFAGASLYIWLKNTLSMGLRQAFYGGAFEIPEFQVNERMVHTFGTEEKAQDVRAFYISQLKQCDILEKSLHKKETWLNTDEKKQREDNTHRRDALCLEWYDIHSGKMPIDKVPDFVVAQLYNTIGIETEQLENELTKEAKDIATSVTQFTHQLRDSVHACSMYPVGEVQKMPIQFSNRLFKPPIHSIIHKCNAESMDALSESISPSFA
ncbi:MAG: hypothetical protein H0U75_08970 [Legionella sp.]|nr:hypothetical protein [Legionella sp.]